MTTEQIKQTLQKLKTETQLLKLHNHETLGDWVVVVPAEIHESGITTRVQQFEDRPEIGLVVAVGKNVENINVGNVVFFGKYSTVQLTFDDVTYVIFRQEDVYCVANP